MGATTGKEDPPNKERKQEEWGGSPGGEKRLSGNLSSGWCHPKDVAIEDRAGLMGGGRVRAGAGEESWTATMDTHSLPQPLRG